jgi:hypothetical protein
VKPITIAIGINFGTYVLLAADTRTMRYNQNGSIRDYVDDSTKIQKTSIGLITGAGSKELLDLVKERLEKEKISHTNQILHIIKKERLHYQRIFWRTAEEDIPMTGWIFSYPTIDKRNPKLRLGMIHPTLGDVLALYQENNPAVIGPHEATEEDICDVCDFLKKEIKPFKEFSTLSDSIRYHWLLIARLIQRIQPHFPSISSHCQIGVHTLDNLRGISSILKDTDPGASISLTGDQI